MPAININNSSKEVLKQSVVYTGLTQVKMVAVNPTLKELQEMGYNFQQEPVYLTEEEGVRKLRLDFYFKNATVSNKITFFLENRPRVNKDGTKNEFINHYGQSTWAADLNEALNKTASNGKKWFNAEGAREAYVGETSLIEFLKQWLNTNPNDKVYIEDMEALFKGNVKELQYYVNAAKDNIVWVLLTYSEKEGKYYQNVDNGLFIRGYFKQVAAFSKAVEYIKRKEKDGYPVKGYNGLEFKEFVPPAPEVILPDSDLDMLKGKIDDGSNVF